MKRSELNLKVGDEVVYTDDGATLTERVELALYSGDVLTSYRDTAGLVFTRDGRTYIPRLGVSDIIEVNGEAVTED
jgi:hypothetical protein